MGVNDSMNGMQNHTKNEFITVMPSLAMITPNT